MDRSNLFKTFTDPIHGFVTVPKGTVLKLMDHPYVQRLRRIRQLGLGFLVFPGAEHSRFSHALGALGLMQRALQNLKDKGTTITFQEMEAACIGILLHDIGHGPFSHTLEGTFIKGFHHEIMTEALMSQLNMEMNGDLDMAITVFNDQYRKRFLHQLISSQLDIDRLDYLKRDSTFTGVYEGSIGIDRILQTMRVHKGNIVIERKGVYAIENYVISRRLMYLQVYQHKTVFSADKLLRSIFTRVRYLTSRKVDVPFPSPSIGWFMQNNPDVVDGLTPDLIKHYVSLDDNDVLMSIKVWMHHKDPVLRDLCTRFMNRNLQRCVFLEDAPSEEFKQRLTQATKRELLNRGLPNDEHTVNLYLQFGSVTTETYKNENDRIWILDGTGKQAREFSKSTDAANIMALTKPLVRHYVVHFKNLSIK
jgi:uncharacterized protein